MRHNDSEQVRRTLGANVRAAREALGWSQTDLATRGPLRDIGMTRDKVVKLEAGTRPTPVDEAVAVAAVLGVPLQRLIGHGEDAAAGEAVELVKSAISAQSALSQAALDLEARAEAVRAIPDDVAQLMPRRWRNQRQGAGLAPEDWLARWMVNWREVQQQAAEGR